MATLEPITKDSLLEKMNNGEKFELVNVLEPSSYHLGFIKGSKKIPVSELDKRVGELDKNLEVIVYCASVECSASKKAADKLQALGYKVKIYPGGIREWKEAGLAMEPGVRLAA